MTANEALHLAYNSIIRELAEKGDCVFVGRCADYILEQAKIDHISLFIAAPFEWRVKRKMEQLSIDEKSATAMVRKKDKDRTIIPAETGEGHMSTICVLTVPGLELKQLQRSL